MFSAPRPRSALDLEGHLDPGIREQQRKQAVLVTTLVLPPTVQARQLPPWALRYRCYCAWERDKSFVSHTVVSGFNFALKRFASWPSSTWKSYDNF